MCAANKQSLEVSYAHLSQACPILAVWVADVPKQMFAMFNEVAHQVCTVMKCSCIDCITRTNCSSGANLQKYDHPVAKSCSANNSAGVAEQVALDKLPDYGEIASEVFVRITDLPIQDSIRDLRCGSCRRRCIYAGSACSAKPYSATKRSHPGREHRSFESNEALTCRQYHLNALVRLTGVVTRRTGVFPQLQRVRALASSAEYCLLRI
jgi:DNA replicative helicase MCM subunit Mcm2 (Cdc46/Mcm family)